MGSWSTSPGEDDGVPRIATESDNGVREDLGSSVGSDSAKLRQGS